MIDTTVSSDQGHPMGDPTSVPLSDHLPGFLAARSYVPESVKQRTSLLRRFFDATGDPAPKDLTVQLVYAWWGALGALSNETRRSHLSAVRTFLGHLIAIGELETDPTASISRPPNVKAAPVTLSDNELRLLAAVLNTWRDRVIVVLMVGCGLRSGDVARLRVQDIDFESNVLSVTGKGGKVRLVPVPQAAINTIQKYLRARPADSGPLVRQLYGTTGLRASSIQMRMARMLMIAGVKQSAFDGKSSHSLRRTCATVLLDSGVSIRDVQTILGHESLASTEHYLARPNAKRLQEAIERGPLGSSPPAA